MVCLYIVSKPGEGSRIKERKERTMKQTTRKLLSLVMALAIVLSLAPTAWANDVTATISSNKANNTVYPTQKIKLTVSLDDDTKIIQSVAWNFAGTSTAKAAFGITSDITAQPYNFCELEAIPDIREVQHVEVTATVSYKDSSDALEPKTVTSAPLEITAKPDPTPVATSIVVNPSNGMSFTVGSNTTPKSLTATVKDQNGTSMTGTGAPTVTFTKGTTNSNLISLSATSAKSGESITVSLTDAASAIDSVKTVTINVSTSGVQSSVPVTVTINPAADPAITIPTSLSLSSTTTSNSITASLLQNVTTGLDYYRVHWTTNSSSIARFYNSGEYVNEIDTYFTTTDSTVTVYRGTTAGTTTVYAQLQHYSSGQWRAVGTPKSCSVSVSGSLPLSPSSITVPYGGTSYATATDLDSWSTAHHIDWSVTNGTGSARIRNSTSGSWGTSATTTVGSTTTSSTIYIYGLTSGTVTLTAVLKNSSNQELARNSKSITVASSGFSVVATNPSNTSAVYINDYWNNAGNGYYCTFIADPRLSSESIRDDSDYSIYYVWTVNGHIDQSTLATSGNNRAGYSYTLYSDNSYLNYYWNSDSAANTVTCTAYVRESGTASASNYDYYNSVTWNVYTNYGTDFSVGVTVYDTNTGYDLMDIPDEGDTSIADQINNWINKYYPNSGPYNYTVRVYGGTAYETGTTGNRGTLTSSSSSTWLNYSDLDKVVFTPVSTVSNTSGYYTVSYRFDVNIYYLSNKVADYTLTGTMTFTVKQGASSSGDISYTAQVGKDVSLDVEDFKDFWTDRYTKGSLTSVVFGTPNGTPSGTVYNSNNKSVGSTSYFVEPTSKQSGLDGIYFSPSSSKVGTVRIPFTATGRTGSGSSSPSNTLYGTIVITYLKAAADTITYTTDSNGKVSLKAQDFIDAYKAAMDTSTTPSNLTIQFQGVPSYGTLTYTGGTKDVRLTSSNIKSYKFAARTSTSGTNQIGDVTYSVSNSRADTISYIGYIGSTATFSGEVTFNAVTVPEDLKIAYTCYSTAGVTLTPSSFTSAHTAMSNASYVVLGTPRTGTLSYSGAALPSTILVNSLSSVTYIPSAAVTGTATTDSFTFAAYNSSNNKVASGTVTITISLPATPSTSGTITSITQFTDIPASSAADWYRAPLAELIKKGVIKGKGDGKFGPRDEVEYSEALKFIMNAAGIVETEVSTPGVNWAQNYKSRAVSSGWISSNVDLTKPIPREAMVELAAKVLGVPASTAASPFTDTTNQWAVALYNTTPRIIQGSNDARTGKLVFRPNQPLYRDEMVALVYRMYQYSGK